MARSLRRRTPPDDPVGAVVPEGMSGEPATSEDESAAETPFEATAPDRNDPAGEPTEPDTSAEPDPEPGTEIEPEGDAGPGTDTEPGGDAGPGAEEPDGPRTKSITTGIGALEPDNAGPGAAAFFDIDNTIMKGSSFAALAKGMADRDYFTTSEIVEFTWKQLKFVLSGKENLDDIAQATENGLAFVKGRNPEEIRQLADEVYDEKMIQRLWSGSVELAEAHQRLGHEVWLVSATPVEVAEEIAGRLALTGGLGTVAEVEDGVYTGRLDGPPLHGAAKLAAITELAAQRGLDLARCAAYSDSANDIPMLSAVGFPVAVNPDGALRSHARKNGWPIRDYRIRGRDSVRRGVPAAAAAGAAVGVAVGVAKAISAIRDGGTPSQ